MDPAAKAVELRDRFRDENYNFEAETLSAAKSAAIQLVKIIIEENEWFKESHNELTVFFTHRLRYWNAVKTELIKL